MRIELTVADDDEKYCGRRKRRLTGADASATDESRETKPSMKRSLHTLNQTRTRQGHLPAFAWADSCVPSARGGLLTKQYVGIERAPERDTGG